MNITSLISVALASVLAENFIFSRFLGVTSFLEHSDSPKSAVKNGVAVMVFLTAASVIASLLELAIAPLGLSYMRTVIFVLVLAGLAAIAGRLMIKAQAFPGVSVPLVVMNAAFLGVMLLTSEKGYNPLEALVFGFFAGIGYLAASALFAAVGQELEYSETPKWLEGVPMALITAGLIALAFSGFAGLRVI